MKSRFITLLLCLLLTNASHADLTESEVSKKVNDMGWLLGNTIKSGSKCKKLMERLVKPSTEISVCKIYKKSQDKVDHFFADSGDIKTEKEKEQVYKALVRAVGPSDFKLALINIKTTQQQIQQMDKLYK